MRYNVQNNSLTPGCSSLVAACLTVVCEIQGLNPIMGTWYFSTETLRVPEKHAVKFLPNETTLFQNEIKGT